MKKPLRHTFLWSAITAVLAGFGAGIAFLVQEPYLERRRLPDGTTFTLHAVTWGKQHRFIEGNRLQQLLLSLSPTWKAAGGRLYVEKSGKEALGFWIREKRSPNGPPAPPEPLIAAYDAHGCRITAEGGRAETGIHLALFPAFPRREKTVSLGWYDPVTGPQAPQVSFVVPNPTAGTFPTWKGERLPVTRRSNGMEFSLKRLETRDFGRFAGAHFGFRKGGAPTSGWEPVTLTVSDATGNSRTEQVSYYSSEGERAWFPPLCLEEAWKLEVEFAPEAISPEPPAFTWTVRNVPVPPHPQPNSTSSTFSSAGTTRGGVRLKLKEIYRGGSEGAWVPGDEEDQYAVVEVASERGLRLTLARVTDERGRDLTLHPQPEDGNSPGQASQVFRASRGEYSFGLRIPPDAKRLNLTFAVYPTRRVEFLVDPRSAGISSSDDR